MVSGRENMSSAMTAETWGAATVISHPISVSQFRPASWRTTESHHAEQFAMDEGGHRSRTASGISFSMDPAVHARRWRHSTTNDYGAAAIYNRRKSMALIRYYTMSTFSICIHGACFPAQESLSHRKRHAWVRQVDTVRPVQYYRMAMACVRR